MTHSELNERGQLVAVSTVGSSPIDPWAIGASMPIALGRVHSLDWCTIVAISAGADFHTIGMMKLGVRSHTCTIVRVSYCVTS